MDIKQLEQNIKDAEAALEKAKQQLEEAKECPQVGDDYYAVYDGGVVKFTYCADKIDLRLQSINKIFRTKEEAERELKRDRAVAQLERMCDGGFIYISFNSEIFVTERWNYTTISPWRFSTYEKAKQAIETLGEEKLRLIFNLD